MLTGTPIREELFNGSKEEALKICEFKEDKPILLIIGGSLGSRFINDNVRNMLTEFLKEFNIIHVCGKGNLQENLKNLSGYRQFEYVKKELPHFMNGADIVISRAGANVIFELLALKKPNLLIPLSRKSSRGDQILNARSFEKSGYSVVIEEEELNSENLLNELKNLYKYKDRYIKAMNSSPVQNGVDNIIRLIEECSK